MATLSDLKQVVVVHQEAFPNFFLTKMGKHFLYAYYKTVLSYPESIFIVAVDEAEKKILGFVSGFINNIQYYRYMEQCKRTLLFPTLLGFLHNPSMIGQIIMNRKRISGISQQTAESSSQTSELSSIGVLNDTKNTGLGKTLTTEFIKISKEKNADHIILTTDARNNDHVNQFYLRQGFELVHTFIQPPNREMNKYIYHIK
jgi:ribosomal protein S18 acetylase RimI-like enzyme